MFTSPDSGAIAHTACSRLIVTNREFEDAIGTELVELAPAARRTAEAIRRFGETGEPDHTPYALENGMPIFQMFKEQPERGRRLGSAMRYFTKDVGWDLKYLVEGYDWRSLDDPSTTILDVGGGHGAVTIALANATNHMRFVVQDQSATVDQGRKELPEELRGRVEFREHDFFTQQTVKGATVYLMRWILHNWSDESCVKILRELAPAMSANSKIILLEHFISEDPETPFTEKMGM
ncbi:MAG: hypothetical protein LQ342_007928 [Letrouitia transgressa]|nr:MAG: hypothetical protein LQ342_007928 [Letrouitia transgressa]